MNGFVPITTRQDGVYTTLPSVLSTKAVSFKLTSSDRNETGHGGDILIIWLQLAFNMLYHQ